VAEADGSTALGIAPGITVQHALGDDTAVRLTGSVLLRLLGAAVAELAVLLAGLGALAVQTAVRLDALAAIRLNRACERQREGGLDGLYSLLALWLLHLLLRAEANGLGA